MANMTPAKLILFSFSLNTKTPMRVPAKMVPTLINGKTTDASIPPDNNLSKRYMEKKFGTPKKIPPKMSRMLNLISRFRIRKSNPVVPALKNKKLTNRTSPLETIRLSSKKNNIPSIRPLPNKVKIGKYQYFVNCRLNPSLPFSGRFIKTIHKIATNIPIQRIGPICSPKKRKAAKTGNNKDIL